jgi:hypothetical protein
MFTELNKLNEFEYTSTKDTVWSLFHLGCGKNESNYIVLNMYEIFATGS